MKNCWKSWWFWLYWYWPDSCTVCNDAFIKTDINNVVSAATQLVGWSLRSFRSRSKHVMLTMWKSLIQSKLDYTSQLWSPSDQANIGCLESVARNFTARISGMQGLDYWERLKSLKLYYQERRRDRYRIIFLWKVGQGLVQGYKVPFTTSQGGAGLFRSAHCVTVPQLQWGRPGRPPC